MVLRLPKQLILELYPLTTLPSYSQLDHGYSALKGTRLEDLCSGVSYLCAVSWVLVIRISCTWCDIAGTSVTNMSHHPDQIWMYGMNWCPLLLRVMLCKESCYMSLLGIGVLSAWGFAMCACCLLQP